MRESERNRLGLRIPSWEESPRAYGGRARQGEARWLGEGRGQIGRADRQG